MTDTLGMLYEIFGARAVLLPIPLRRKGPVFDGWQSTTFARTQEPDYQELLNAAIARKGNIGVLLTAGLVSLDIDEDTWVDAFALKQPFSETLRSKGKRGCNFWFTMIGNYPNGKNVYNLKEASGTKIGEWRCGPGAQTVIWGQHPESTDDTPIWLNSNKGTKSDIRNCAGRACLDRFSSCFFELVVQRSAPVVW
jgi:hypothetical protein